MVLSLGGLGKRSMVTKIRKFLDMSSPKLCWKTLDENCAFVGLVNAINCMLNREEAVRYMDELRNIPLKVHDLGQQHAVLQAACRRVGNKGEDLYEMRRVSKQDWPIFQKSQFVSLEKQNGCFLVWLVKDDKKDHCVILDGKKTRILDCEEDYPILMTERTIRMCGDSCSLMVRVHSVQQMVVQKE